MKQLQLQLQPPLPQPLPQPQPLFLPQLGLQLHFNLTVEFILYTKIKFVTFIHRM